MRPTRSISFALLAALAACGSDRGAPPVAAARPAPVASVAPAAPVASTAPLSGDSIYDLALALRDQDGRAIGVDVHRGHPALIAMFYASCPAACPRLIDAVGEVLAGLPPERRAETRVLLVSFDGAHDTPAVLAALGRARGLDPARWTLAAAGAGDARLLAALLGIKYRPLDGGQYFHTSVITAVDGDGHPLARLEGLGDVAPLVAAIP